MNQWLEAIRNALKEKPPLGHESTKRETDSIEY